MRRVKSRFMKMVMLFIFITSLVMPAIQVRALTLGSGENGKIKIELSSDSTEFNDREQFQFTFKYEAVGEIGKLKEGDEISFNLPEEFRNADIRYPENHFKEIVKSGDKVTLVFGQDAKKAAAGYIYAKGRVTSATSETKRKFVVEFNGVAIFESKEITIKPYKPVVVDPVPSEGGSQVVDRLLFKNVEGSIGEDDKGNILSQVTGRPVGKTKKYSIYINEKYSIIYNAKLVDKMPDGMELDPDSVKILKADLDGQVTDKTNEFYKVRDITMLNIDFGTIDSKYIVEYDGKFTLEKDSYVNTAMLYKDDGTITSTAIVNRNFDESRMVSKYAHDLKEVKDSDGQNIKVASMNDNVPYSVYINNDKLYIENVIFEDFIPKGMTYVDNSLMIGQYDDKEKFTWITDTMKDKVNISDSKITINFGNTEYKYIVYYKLKIVETEKSYENKARVSYGDKIKETSEIVKYEMNAGAINVEKLIDKATIKFGEDTNVVYTIAFDSFGYFEKNYLQVEDKLDSRAKILKVEATEHFSATVDSNTNTVRVINDKLDVLYGESLKVKIYADLSGVEDGSTVSNVAKINDINTNEVKTKKGYAFTAKKVDFDDESKVLQDAKFLLKDSKGNTVKELISDNQGIIKSNIAEPGIYYLEETIPPRWYEKLKDSIAFEIKEENIGTTIDLGNIKNKKKTENVASEEVITEPTWEETKEIIPVSPTEETVKPSTEEGLNKPTVEIPEIKVDEEVITEPTWEETKEIIPVSPTEETIKPSTEEGLNKPKVEIPEIKVDEEVVTEPTWEETKEIISVKPMEETATVSKVDDLETATVNKPKIIIAEKETDKPTKYEPKEPKTPDNPKEPESTNRPKDENKGPKAPEKPKNENKEPEVWEKPKDFKPVEITVESKETTQKIVKDKVMVEELIKKESEAKVVKQPKTGDNGIGVYVVTLIISILGLGLIRKK